MLSWNYSSISQIVINFSFEKIWIVFIDQLQFLPILWILFMWFSFDVSIVRKRSVFDISDVTTNTQTVYTISNCTARWLTDHTLEIESIWSEINRQNGK